MIQDKIELLKSTIIFLYEKEGRSINYISKLLELNRKKLSEYIKELNLVQANSRRLKPSTQKFLNKHKSFIKSRIDKDMSITEIANELKVSRSFLSKLISKDELLSKSKEDYINRKKDKAYKQKQEQMIKSYYNYGIEDIEGEEWKEILGYNDYFISNKGRVKRYSKSYDNYFLLKPYKNINTSRLYIKIKDKNIQLSRLVGFAFLEGYSLENNTIDHIDGDCMNNEASNLQWVSQSVNNKRTYAKGKKISVPYSLNGRFKKIILNDNFEFKTITALAKFCNVSETQMNRYIHNETQNDYNIKFVY